MRAEVDIFKDSPGCGRAKHDPTSALVRTRHENKWRLAHIVNSSLPIIMRNFRRIDVSALKTVVSD